MSDKLTIEYGLKGIFINITNIVFSKCIEMLEGKRVLFIAKDDCYRAKLLGDPLPGIQKVIKVKINGITIIYTHDKEVKLFLD
jgi:hypothetical protein